MIVKAAVCIELGVDKLTSGSEGFSLLSIQTQARGNININKRAENKVRDIRASRWKECHKDTQK